MFNLYQARLTDAQINEVNLRGWEAHKLYVDLQLLFGSDEKGIAAVFAANAYFRHTAIVDVESLEEVFEVTNVGPLTNVTRVGQMRSCSVGDVVIRADHKGGAVCLPMGWAVLTEQQVREWECMVTTVMLMGDPI